MFKPGKHAAEMGKKGGKTTQERITQEERVRRAKVGWERKRFYQEFVSSLKAPKGTAEGGDK